MTIAFTGHRPDKLGGEYLQRYIPNRMYQEYGPISKALFHEVQALLKIHEATSVISGMALGFDQIGAHAALNMGIPVIAAIPFKGQEGKWSRPNQDWYHCLLSRSKPVYICNPGFAKWKMQKRNEWMVDQCDRLIAAWDGSEGGTANCIDYADGRKPISHIDIKELISL